VHVIFFSREKQLSAGDHSGIGFDNLRREDAEQARDALIALSKAVEAPAGDARKT
jgi:hypothetical protein